MDRVGDETRVTLQINPTDFGDFSEKNTRLVSMTSTQTGHMVFTFETSGTTKIVVRRKSDQILGIPNPKKLLDNTRRIL